MKAWITYVKKDGTERHSGTIATNPAYVAKHKDWVWKEIECQNPKAKKKKKAKGEA